MDRLKAYSIERINGRFKKNKHLEWSDTSCLFLEIERLKKEKEWLLEKICSYSAYFLPKDIDKYMQQALKEGK